VSENEANTVALGTNESLMEAADLSYPFDGSLLAVITVWKYCWFATGFGLKLLSFHVF